MQILPFGPDDLHSLTELQPSDWDDIKIPFKYYLSHRNFCTPLKVVIDEKVVGLGTCIFHKDVAWLAHIIVHRDFRNRGIGKFITGTLINRAQLPSIYKTISLIATDLGEPVYKSAGFETVGEYFFLKNEIKTDQFQISPLIKKFESRYLEDVLKIDLAASGEDRSQRLKEYTADSYIFTDGNIARGVYFPTFGDGLIIASNPEAGIELIKFRNQNKNIAALPAENKTAIDFLIQNNFKHYRTAKRMSLGEKLKWIPEKIYNRVSGQIG